MRDVLGFRVLIPGDKSSVCVRVSLHCLALLRHDIIIVDMKFRQ